MVRVPGDHSVVVKTLPPPQVRMFSLRVADKNKNLVQKKERGRPRTLHWVTGELVSGRKEDEPNKRRRTERRG